MNVRLMMLLYGGAAAGLTWLAYLSYAAWRQTSSLWGIAPLATLALIVVVVVVAFVIPQAQSLPLDLDRYPPTARLLVLLVFGIVGRLFSNMGQRRWRSGVSLEETRAAYRQGA